MSLNVPSHYALQFANNIQLLLQQKGSKLRGTTMEGSHRGESASPVDQYGAVEMQEVTSRFQPMGRVDAAVDRRWCNPISFDLPQMIDSFDLLKTLLDPKSSYVTNAVYAAGRKYDDLILDACFAAASTGKRGATSTSFLAGNIIAVNEGGGGNTGMTVAKLRAAKKKLMGHEVDLDNDPLFCAITSIQADNLLAEAQVISLDYNEKPVLMDGKVTRFLGINFIHCERVDTNASSYRLCPVYAKSGMHLGIWEDMKVDISERKDIQGIPWQVYLKMTAGATRLEEKKVVQVLCAE